MVYNTAYMDFSLGGLLKNLKSALNPKKSVLGLDIGSSFIKLVQLRKEQERAILETYGEIALGPYAKMKIGQNVKLPPDIVAQAVKDLMKESNSKTDTARVSIPLKSSFVKIISLPFGQEKIFPPRLSPWKPEGIFPCRFRKWLWIGGLYPKTKMI